MDVVEIDDLQFRKDVYEGIKRKDRYRQYEIHFTDLPYSLIISFYRKLFPDEYGEAEYATISTWMRGKGHEIGYANLLSYLSPEKQRITTLGHAIGSIDLVHNDMYEMTSTLCWSKYRTLPYIGKTVQLMYYMASERMHEAKLKIWILIVWVCNNCDEICYGLFPPYKCPCCGEKKGFHSTSMEKTWLVTLNDDEIEHYRKLIVKKSNLLYYALVTGDWATLPRTSIHWMKEDEDEIIKWLQEHKGEVKKTHAKWLREFRAREKKPPSRG